MKTHFKKTLFLLALIAGPDLVPAGRAIISGETMLITGYVRDDSGSPVTGVDVAGDDYVGDVYSSKTDVNGCYEVKIKSEGNYRVTVNCAQLTALGYDCVNSGAVTITSGSAGLDFIVHPVASPLLITNIFLPEAYAGTVYKTQLGAKGGRAPYKWQLALDSTNLPAGLVLNSRGFLSGTPMTNNISTINVQVTDSNSSVTNKILVITINSNPLLDAPASQPSPVTTSEISDRLL